MQEIGIQLRAKKSTLFTLGVLGLIFYCPSWNSYFVSDDYHFLGRIDFSQSVQYFAKSWGYGNEYRPLLPFSYSLDATISDESPIGFHVTNTVLHLAIAVLAGLSAYAFGLSASVSILSAVLFFLNPVVHESVLWISGRPVLLGALFVLLSIWTFARSRIDSSKFWYVASMVSFVLALLSYEGASALPFLLAILLLPRSRIDFKVIRLIGPYFLLLIAYTIFWNVLFGGKITRFTVESSLFGAVCSCYSMLKHVFFGSTLGIPLAFYIFLLFLFLRTAKNRRTCMFLFVLMIASYLPFFIVHGFADRFAYLASVPIAILLASMILSVDYGKFRRLAVPILIVVLVGYYGYSMQKRIVTWKEAGEITREITSGIKRLRPNLPADAVLHVLGVPEMYKNAYVFITGLEPAIQHLYHCAGLHVSMNTFPSPEERGNVFVFQYTNRLVEEIVR